MDRNAKGRRLPPLQFAVAGLKIREFVDAIHDTNPVHRDADAARAAGFDGVVAPLTLFFGPTLPGQVELDKDVLFIDTSKALIVGWDLEFRRPLVAGETLTCEATILDVEERSQGTALLARVRFDLLDESGTLVQRQHAAFLERGVA